MTLLTVIFLVSSSGSRAATGSDLLNTGAQLYTETCASCHGTSGAGTERGPSLNRIGEASVDFVLTTGRMPLSRPGVQPLRAKPAFSREEIDALVRYVSSLGPGGPPIPKIDLQRGSVREGRRLFTENCSGCHQIAAEGGIGPGFRAPALTEATPVQVAEAVRIGPYLMPRFSKNQLSDSEVDSIARFVTVTARNPEDRGGWGIGHIGPIAEGLVALLLGGGVILILTRAIGEGGP
jgi:ubiquinol-cytochrome c reductase cytochrome c subunit